MKNRSALNWIIENSKHEFFGLVLLVICDALFSVCSVSLAVFAKLIIDCAASKNREELVKNAVILLLVIVLQIALKLAGKALEVRVSGKLEMKYKTKLFSNILKKDYLRISAFHSGELMTRLTSDVTLVSQAVTSIVPSVVSMVTRLLCAFAVLFYLDRWFALLFLAAGIALFVFTRIFRGSMKKLHTRVQQADGKVRSFMQESIESILVVKIFGVGDKLKEKAEALIGEIELLQNQIEAFDAPWKQKYNMSVEEIIASWDAPQEENVESAPAESTEPEMGPQVEDNNFPFNL